MGRNVAQANAWQIGDCKEMPDLGTIVTDGNNRKWLRDGILLSAASYPEAANMEHMKVIGSLSSNTVAIKAYDIATDGNNIFVIVNGSTTGYVTTDGGANFNAVTIGINAVSVCYSAALDMFIAAGNDGSNIQFSSVTKANVTSSWTVRTSTGGAGFTTDSARVRACGSNIIVAVSGSTGSASARSTNGTSFTAVNLATAMSGAQTIRIAGDGTNTILMVDQGGGVNRSINGGTSWTVPTPPTQLANARGIVYANSRFNIVDSALTTATSSDGSNGTWTVKQNLYPGAPTAAVADLVHDSTNYVIPCQRNSTYFGLLYSSDLVTWQIRKNFVNYTSVQAATYCGNSNGRSVIAASGSAVSSIQYHSGFNTASYIGNPVVTSTGAIPLINYSMVQ